jgi:hypothetical protein
MIYSSSASGTLSSTAVCNIWTTGSSSIPTGSVGLVAICSSSWVVEGAIIKLSWTVSMPPVGLLLLGIFIGYLDVDNWVVRKGLALFALFFTITESPKIPVAVDIIFEGLVITSVLIIGTG